jgi:outer membrane protein OmpA-like peptidoglycan-associated protein
MNLLDVAGGRCTAVMLAVAVAVTAWFAVPNTAPRRIVVTETETTILDRVEFTKGTAKLAASAGPILEAVSATLRGNPSITLIEVQAHTDGRGCPHEDQRLSERRAAAVMAYLVASGVESARLVAQGYGDTQPIERNAPTKNERVSFLILKRSGE